MCMCMVDDDDCICITHTCDRSIENTWNYCYTNPRKTKPINFHYKETQFI